MSCHLLHRRVDIEGGWGEHGCDGCDVGGQLAHPYLVLTAVNALLKDLALHQKGEQLAMSFILQKEGMWT